MKIKDILGKVSKGGGEGDKAWGGGNLIYSLPLPSSLLPLPPLHPLLILTFPLSHFLTLPHYSHQLPPLTFSKKFPFLRRLEKFDLYS